MTPTRRRWFAFSLRGMFALMAIACAFLAFLTWEWHFILERRRSLDWLEENQHGYLGWDDNLISSVQIRNGTLPKWLRSGKPIKSLEPNLKDIPWLRAKMGDKTVVAIGLKEASQLARMQELYPEAIVFLPAEIELP